MKARIVLTVMLAVVFLLPWRNGVLGRPGRYQRRDRWHQPGPTVGCWFLDRIQCASYGPAHSRSEGDDHGAGRQPDVWLEATLV